MRSDHRTDAEPCIAIVNAYSSANQLAPALLAHGARCVHVRSREQLLGLHEASFRPQDFEADFVFTGDLGGLAAQLRSHGVSQVIAGSEYGVELAESLAAAHGFPTNDPATTALRRDKFAMIAALHAAGIPAARQALCRSRGDAESFAAPVAGRTVVKPLASALNDGVFFCDGPEAAGAACAALLGRRSVYDTPIDAVVVQSYLDGEEFYLNTMSRDGVHRVAEIWRTTHVAANGVHNLLDSAILMPATGEIQERLREYAFACLDALGVTDSPAHLEIRMTREGPRLVELGARLVGGPLSRIARLVSDDSQIDAIARAYLDPETFKATAARPYRADGSVSSTALISRWHGQLRGYPGLNRVRGLESFREAITLLKPGAEICPTVNDLTYPMMIVLAHADPAAVLRDSRTVRLLDDRDFYDLST